MEEKVTREEGSLISRRGKTARVTTWHNFLVSLIPQNIGTDVNNKTISQSVIEKLKLMRLDCTVMLCEKSGAFILRTKLCTCNM